LEYYNQSVKKLYLVHTLKPKEMKKILTTLLLITGVSGVFAQWQQGGPNQQNGNYPQQNGNYNYNSALTINSASQRQISVSVDNYQYQANGNGQEINVGQLQSGNHNIVIYEWRRNFWGKTVQQVVYNSTLYFKPGFETNIFINMLGQVSITERQLYNNGGYNQGGYGNNGRGVGNGYGRMKNKHKKNKCGNDNRRGWDDD
jgi:hypothetical protein